MKPHSCLLCLGSNIDRHAHMDAARKALVQNFPNIRFGREMTTEAIGSKFLSPFSNQIAQLNTSLSAEEVRTILKQIEKENGRLPEDKGKGIVKLDIDLLMIDDTILKPEDLKKEFVQLGI
ncbi:MAG: 2-amino-4-hydroxy-6-hydroxymethyldihydropteridine diphosphokinase [Bacteroides sp.]|nr:2-amino-4-hydroxy-6-hydroxymethyldihydropteridine diphosphokinase [Bacteroides sp.]